MALNMNSDFFMVLNLGIDDPIPVTRDACSSNDAYRRQLSKQTADFLVDHISVSLNTKVV